MIRIIENLVEFIKPRRKTYDLDLILEEIIEYLSKYNEKDRAVFLTDLKDKLSKTAEPSERKIIIRRLNRLTIGMGSLSDIDFWSKATKKEDGYKLNKNYHDLVEKLYEITKKDGI